MYKFEPVEESKVDPMRIEDNPDLTDLEILGNRAGTVLADSFLKIIKKRNKIKPK